MTSTLDKRDEAGNLIDVDDNSTVIYGTQGVMEIFTDPAYSIKVFYRNGEKKYYKAGAIQTNTNQTNSGVIDLFVKNLINHTKAEISGEDALQVMKIVYAIEESSRLQKTVDLNESGGVI